MRGILVPALVAGYFAVTTTSAECATFQALSSGMGGIYDFKLDGEILASDVETIDQEITAVTGEKPDLIDVWLNSSGGDVDAAMKIGRILRQHQVLTGVVGICNSACVLVLASGVNRMSANGFPLIATVGIHRPHFDPSYFANLDATTATARYDALAKEVQQYLADMGMAQSLFEMMMRVPSGSIRTLTPAELRETGLDGSDPAYDEWVKAHRALENPPSAPLSSNNHAN